MTRLLFCKRKPRPCRICGKDECWGHGTRYINYADIKKEITLLDVLSAELISRNKPKKRKTNT